MADTTSRSDDDSASPRAQRNSESLRVDRGVINREAWAVARESDSETESSSETEDEYSPGIPLTQREDAQDSGEETEDDGVLMRHELQDARTVRIKSEDVDDTDSSSDESDSDSASDSESESEYDEDDEISIKREHHQEIGAEMKSEEEDARKDGVDEDASSRTERVVEPAEDEGHANEEGAVNRSRDADIAADHLVGRERDQEEEQVHAEYDELEEEVDERDMPARRDVEAARQLIDRFYQSHLSFTEQSELHKGKRISGPPIDRAISQADQWKRKYRWPVAMRNVRRRRFTADATEIASDHDVQLVEGTHAMSNDVSAAAREAFAAALAPTARPLMTTAVATFREQNETRQREMPFVVRLEKTKDSDSASDAVDATRLRALTRLGGQFADQVLESLLVKNLVALQGVDASYAQQCWDPLPTSKRPVANWRFVLEHFCRTSTHGVDAMRTGSVPRLRKDTLIRIRDRLQKLYGVAWRPEDAAFFNLVDQQEMDPPDPSQVYRL